MPGWIVILLSSLIIVAQQTPLPTKTDAPPVAEATQSVEQTTPAEQTPVDDLTPEAQSFRTRSQEDLQVITGNVQRPNAMIWHDGKLYIACTGDWTLYEVDDTTGTTRTYISGVRNAHQMVAENDERGELILWVPDFDANVLWNVVRTRSPQSVAADIDRAWGVARLDENGFLVSSMAQDEILMVSNTGDTRTVVDGLRAPAGIAVDDERVYVANSGGSRRSIEWLPKQDVIDNAAVVPQPLVRGLQNTSNLVVAPDGYLYFTYSVGSRGVVGRVDAQRCAEAGGCDNDSVEVVVYTDLPAPLAGLTFSDDMRLFVHTMFRPEVYWVSLTDE